MAKPEFLVVEDNEVDVRYLRHVLSKAGITAISHARDGEQAIAQLRSLTEGLSTDRVATQIVMLLDLNLPVMNGFDVLKFVQTNPLLSRMKIFVVTSNDDELSRELAAKWGATGYIVKPLSLAQIANILETIGQPARRSAPATSVVSES